MPYSGIPLPVPHVDFGDLSLSNWCQNNPVINRPDIASNDSSKNNLPVYNNAMKKKLGRPPIPKSKRKVRLNITMSPQTLRNLDKLPESNSWLVEEAVINFYDFEAPKGH